MFRLLAVFLVIVPLTRTVVIRNDTTITDLGTTSQFNQTKDALVTSANYTTDEMVETSCHIISEQLVATATATVSAAFSDLCRTDQMTAQLDKLQARYLKELDVIKNKVDKIMKHFIISESDVTTNATT